MTMNGHDEARILRLRLQEMEDEAYRRSGGGGCGQSGSYLLKTKSLGAYPPAPARFFACDFVVPDGIEAAGESVTLAVEPGPVFALNLGTRIPPPGTVVKGYVSDGCYIFQYDGPEI